MAFGVNALSFLPYACEKYTAAAKGQLISECLFDFLNFPKNHWKIWQISAQGSKSGQIIREMSLNALNSPYNHM